MVTISSRMKFFSVVLILSLFIQFFFMGSVVKFDNDGTLVVNGKRTLIYGTFRDASEDWRKFDSIKEASFNLTHDYYFELKAYEQGADQWIKDAVLYLDIAEKAGVGVFLGLPRELVWSSRMAEIEELIAAVKDKPALWLWYMMDEPTLQYEQQIKKGTVKDLDEALNKLKLLYETIKKADPNHPAVLVDPYIRMKEHPEFGQYCDSIWPDIYSHRYSILKLKRDIEGLQSIHPGKPNIGIPHAGSLLPYVRRNELKNGQITFPKKLRVTDKSLGNTPDVIWGNLHSCLSAGSQGVIYYWAPKYLHDIKKDTPGNWKTLCDIGKTLNKMEPVLVEGDPNAGVKMVVDKWGHLNRQLELTGEKPSQKSLDEYDTVAMWQRKFKDDIYVGVVCDFVPVQKVTLKLPFQIGSVSLMPQNKEVIKISPDGNHRVDYDSLPVLLWNMTEDEMTFVIHDAKSLMLKFEESKQ